MLPIATAASRRLLALPASVRHRVAAQSRSTTGRLIALVSFVGTALGGVLAKAVYAAGAEPVSFLVLRLVAAVLVLGLLARRRLVQIPLSAALRLLGLGLFFGVQTMIYYVALSLSPVALVVVTVSCYPVVVLLLDAVAARERPSAERVGLVVLSLVGLWVAAGSPMGRPDAGMLLALLGAVAFAVYLRLSEAVFVNVPALVGTWWSMSGALLLMVVLALITAPAWPTATGVALASLQGVLATALPLVGIYAALKRIRASDVAALGPLEPVLATAAAVALLGERLTLSQIGGSVIVLATVAALAGVRPRAVITRLPFYTVRRGPKTRRFRGVEHGRGDSAQIATAKQWGRVAGVDGYHRPLR